MGIWLDASAGITSDGNGVSAWADQSTGGNNATQSDNAKKPAYDATGFNGLPTVTVDGGDNMIFSGISETSDWWACVWCGDFVVNQAGAEKLFDSSTGRLVFAGYEAGSGGGVAWYDGAWQTFGSILAGAHSIIWNVNHATESRLYVDGIQVGSDSAGQQKALGNATRIFSNNNGSSDFMPNGTKTSEFAMVKGGLTVDEVALWTGYLANKWGYAP